MSTDKATRDRLRELLAKATPGPWTATNHDGETNLYVVGGASRFGHDIEVTGLAFWCGPDGTTDQTAEDAQIIAESHNALASLLDDADALDAARAKNARLVEALCAAGKRARINRETVVSLNELRRAHEDIAEMAEQALREEL